MDGCVRACSVSLMILLRNKLNQMHERKHPWRRLEFLYSAWMAWTRPSSLLKLLTTCHSPTCQTLSNVFLKSMKLCLVFLCGWLEVFCSGDTVIFMEKNRTLFFGWRLVIAFFFTHVEWRGVEKCWYRCNWWKWVFWSCFPWCSGMFALWNHYWRPPPPPSLLTI